ncbi:hypothetical protein HYW74_00040 [Candidatus Pacearchaeota archaeon]|nr:hypothetical protein [Candidatus Pacearchaeota archaeon]
MNYHKRRHHNKVLCEYDIITKTYYSEAGFRRELLAYEILAENNLPLTRIVNIDYKNRSISFKKIDYEDGLEKLTKERVRNASNILYKFHNIPVDQRVAKEISDLRFPIYRFSENLIEHVINKYIKGLKKYFDMGEVEYTLRRLGSKLRPEKFSYTWFDAKMRHFFFDHDDTVRAIIDFEYFGIFDPLADIGNIFADISESEVINPSPLFNAILENYPLNKNSLEILPFYMVTSKLTQALCIDLPKGDMESATKAVELSKIFASQDLF